MQRCNYKAISLIFASSLTRDLLDWPNIPHRVAEWRPCIPVELDVVLTDVEATSIECINSKTGVSSNLIGKPSAPNLSPSQAFSLNFLETYRLVFMR